MSMLTKTTTQTLLPPQKIPGVHNAPVDAVPEIPGADDPPGDDAKIPGMDDNAETPVVDFHTDNDAMVVEENINPVEENVNPAGLDKDMNPYASFPPLPPPPDAEDEPIIQPNIEQAVVKDVLGGDKDTGGGAEKKFDSPAASNYNGDGDGDGNSEDANNKNAIADDSETEIEDREVFHPIVPSPSEKQVWTFSCMQLRKHRRLTYIHIHKFEN